MYFRCARTRRRARFRYLREPRVEVIVELYLSKLALDPFRPQAETWDIRVGQHPASATDRRIGAATGGTARAAGRGGHGHDVQGAVDVRPLEETKLRRALHHVLQARTHVGSLHAEGSECAR